MTVDEQLIQKAAAYRPPVAALGSIKQVPLLFAVGVTAAGKDTVLKRLVASHPDMFQFLVSYTTRLPRQNDGVMEQNGVDYHFIDTREAERMLDDGEFVEANYFAGNIYGTGIAEIARVQQTHKIGIKDVEVQGVTDYVQLGMNVKPVFLLPASFDIWWQRLTTRYGQNLGADNLDRRLNTARKELQCALDNDFFYLVVNDKLDDTVDAVAEIARNESIEHRPARAIEVIYQLIEGIETHLTTDPGTL